MEAVQINGLYQIRYVGFSSFLVTNLPCFLLLLDEVNTCQSIGNANEEVGVGPDLEVITWRLGRIGIHVRRFTSSQIS